MKYYEDFAFKLPMVLDGATGTELMKRGMEAGESVHSWVLSHPDELEQIQREYIRAGADAVLTCTFGATQGNLERDFGSQTTPDAGELCASLCRITRRAAGTQTLIGGDLSPLGVFIAPAGDTPLEAAVAEYARSVSAMEPYVDFFISETNISCAEARACVLAVKQLTSKPVFVTLTVDKNGNTLCGDRLLPSFFTLAAAGADAFGLNCSFGPDLVFDALKVLIPYSAALGIPLVAKPNAGMPHESGGVSTFDLSAREFGEYAARMWEAGIAIIGGCCGTTPLYTEKIKSSITPCAEIKPAELDFTRVICNTRRVAVANTSARAPVAEVSDRIADELDDFSDAEYVTVLLKRGDAQRLAQSLSASAAPIAVTGDAGECALFARLYCGKTLTV